MAVSHRQNQANIIKFCTFYSLPPTPLILHSSSVLSFSLSLQGAEVHAKLWNYTLHSSPCLRVPLALETVNKDEWVRGNNWQRIWLACGQGLFLWWCECITNFAPDTPPPPYDRFLVMCSVAVMVSGKICSWKKQIATFPLTPPKNPVKYGTSMEFSVLLFSFVLFFLNDGCNSCKCRSHLLLLPLFLLWLCLWSLQ